MLYNIVMVFASHQHEAAMGAGGWGTPFIPVSLVGLQRLNKESGSLLVLQGGLGTITSR